MDRRAVMFAFALCMVDANAAKLNKCVDDEGRVTFTQTACPGGLSGEEITVRQSSGGMSLGPVGGASEAEPLIDSAAGITVGGVGASAGGCDGGSDQEIRTAIVRNQIFVGMTDKQAIQSWGRPSEINRSSSGDAQWVYYRGPVDMQFIYVDQSGCVTDWN